MQQRIMKATHKLRALGDAATVVAASPSVAAAAQRLGVDRSTVWRWIKAGAVPRPRGRHSGTAMPAVDETTTPEGWAVTVRAKYDLTETEATLVDLAEQALSLARTETVAAPVRLAAMARFQALVKQLQLEEEADGEVEAPAAGQWPRRVV